MAVDDWWVLEFVTAQLTCTTWYQRVYPVGGRYEICRGTYETCNATRQQISKGWRWPPLMYTVMTREVPVPADDEGKRARR